MSPWNQRWHFHVCSLKSSFNQTSISVDDLSQRSRKWIDGWGGDEWMERFLTPVKINGHAERQNQIWMNENEEIAICNLAQLESWVSLFSLSIRLYVWWITLMLFPLFHFLQCFIFIYFIYIKETGAETVLQTQREYSDAELGNITKLICFWSTNACKPI